MPKYISSISVVNPGRAWMLFTLYPGITNLFELEGQREARGGLWPPPAFRSWGGGAEPAEKKKSEKPVSNLSPLLISLPSSCWPAFES